MWCGWHWLTLSGNEMFQPAFHVCVALRPGFRACMVNLGEQFCCTAFVHFSYGINKLKTSSYLHSLVLKSLWKWLRDLQELHDLVNLHIKLSSLSLCQARQSVPNLKKPMSTPRVQSCQEKQQTWICIYLDCWSQLSLLLRLTPKL